MALVVWVLAASTHCQNGRSYLELVIAGRTDQIQPRCLSRTLFPQQIFQQLVKQNPLLFAVRLQMELVETFDIVAGRQQPFFTVGITHVVIIRPYRMMAELSGGRAWGWLANVRLI
jgi:hypothetical protein